MMTTKQNTFKRLALPGAAALSLLLSACATTSPIQQTRSTFEAGLPTNWQNAASSNASPDTASLSEWWTRFDDPVLDALIETALEHNTDIRSALSAIRQARAERGLTQSELWPSLGASVGASGSETRNRETDRHTSSENYSAGLDASWEVDLFGQQRKYLEASEAELAASVESYHDVQVSLAAEVANNYLTLRSTESQLAIVRQNLESREKTQQIVEWQEQAGEGDALSTQQSLASVEQARAQIPALEQSVVELRNSLAILTGRSPQTFELLPNTEQGLPDAPAAIAVGIPAETLEQRPDVRASERGIEAASANLSAAERSRLPTLNLSGSIGIEALKAGDLFDPQQIIANVVAGLSAPIWDAGRISRNIEIQKENLTQAYLQYESTVLTALGEVENALSSIDKYSQQLSTLERASQAASEATQLAQLQYESGEADLLTVLDAQRTQLSLDQSRITTQAEALQAHVQLYKVLGGGWSNPTETSTL
ncbi:efflux transporter outer membrane subunit [Coraliomargarita parva]|uniref:efflux transporter outer membrane subunit n=1 Tax=Coraliomargarita parva TaxID=3014050 RepID=UPI0022B4EF03|nr:efflux transporter outer membrane subunit [Coraliomargarita parva]